MTQDSIENLFQSIDTIVNARIANLPFDQTIECEVFDITDADKGRYKVKYQASLFIAYGDKNAYNKGDIVYVSIPQNDFSLDKFILNKKESDDKAAVKKLPFLNFAKYENLFSLNQQNTEYAIQFTSNGTDTNGKIFTINNFYGKSIAAGFTRLGVKLSMKTSIQQDMQSGGYGVELIVTGMDQTKTYKNVGSADLETKTFRLQMADMIGANLYNTLGYCNQEKVFDITNFVITNITFRVFQSGNFKTVDGEGVKNQKLFFTNLHLHLGYDIKDFYNTDYKAYLYTEQGYQYNSEFLVKNLYVRFVKLQEADKTNIDIINNALSGINYSVLWEQYDPNAAAPSENSGLISFVTLSGTDSTVSNLSPTNATVSLSTSRSRLKHAYVVIVTDIYANKKYISDTIEFTNMTYLAGSELIDIITGFQVEPAEEDILDYNGKFFIYGQDSSSTNKIISSRDHYLIVNYVPSSDETLTPGLQIGDQVTWIIPATNTMLEPSNAFAYQRITDNNGNIISYTTTKTITNLTSDVDQTEHKFRLPYKIKDYYSPTYTNNTITVKLKRGQNGDFSTTQDILFGTSGSQGNEYNAVVRLYRSTDTTQILNAIPVNDPIGTIYYCKVYLYDYDNREINYDITDFAYSLVSSGTGLNWVHQTLPTVEMPFITLTKVDNLNMNEYLSQPVRIWIHSSTFRITLIYPIAICANSSYTAISGSTVITYDITGKKPTYTKNAFTINKNNDRAVWNIYGDTSVPYAPQLINNELVVPSIYHSNVNAETFTLYCTVEGEGIVWIQQIYMHQNKYPVGITQEEQNKFTFGNYRIDNTLVGRVHDSNYLTSGIVMGDVHNISTNKTTLGLYGFHEETEFFCIDENGYVYLNGGTDNNTENGGVNITNAYMTDSTLSGIVLTDTLNLNVKFNNNFKLSNNAGTVLFSIDASGNLSLAGTIPASKISGTVGNASYATSAGSATSATNASNYVSGGTIATNFSRIQSAIQALGGSYTIA